MFYDVAIYNLIEPVKDVTPFTVSSAALKDASDAGKGDIGYRFIGIGYGAADIYEDLTGDLSGIRRMGSE